MARHSLTSLSVGWITVNVLLILDPPTSYSQVVNMSEDGSVYITIKGYSPDSDILASYINTLPSQGTLLQADNYTVINAVPKVVTDPTVRVIFTPLPNGNAPGGAVYANFTYFVRGHGQDSSIATVSVIVNPVPDPPYATSFDVVTPENHAVNFTLQGGDPDIGDTLVGYITSLPTTGILYSLSPTRQAITTVPVKVTDLTLEFAPSKDKSGVSYVSFMLSDNMFNSSTATVNLVTTFVNQPPVSENATFIGDENTDFLLRLNCSDPEGEAVNVYLMTFPTRGVLYLTQFLGTSYIRTVQINKPSDGSPFLIPESSGDGVSRTIQYNPMLNQAGIPFDVISYKGVNTLNSSVAWITINVNSVNVAPNAFGGNTLMAADSVALLNLTANCQDVDTPNVTVELLTWVPQGKGQLYLVGANNTPMAFPDNAVLPFALPGGLMIYTPPPLQYGQHFTEIQFRAFDGEFYSKFNATMVINIFAVNHLPTCEPVSITLSEGGNATVSFNCQDIDGALNGYLLLSQPAKGRLYVVGSSVPIQLNQIINANSSVVYKPFEYLFGPDSFSMTAQDTALALAQPVDVTITINPVNNAPVAQNVSVQGETNRVQQLNLTAMTTDVDGPFPLTWTVTKLPTSGTLSVSSSQGNQTITSEPFQVPLEAQGMVFYTPFLNARGSNMDQLEFEATDGAGAGSGIGVITISIFTPLPTVPTTQTFSTKEDAPLVLTFSGSNDLVTLVIRSPPAKKTLYQWNNQTNKTGEPITGLNTPVKDPLGRVAFVPLLNEHSVGTSVYTSFLYGFMDGAYASTPSGRVQLIVESVIDAPIALEQTVSTPQDKPVLITLTATTVENTTLTYWLMDLPNKGQLWSVNSNTLEQDQLIVLDNATHTYMVDNEMLYYVPPPKRYGASLGAFNFFVTNSFGNQSHSAAITVDVQTTDEPPVAFSATVTTLEDTAVAVTLLGTDPEGDPFIAKIFTFPNSGLLFQTEDGVTPSNPINSTNVTVSNPNNTVIYLPFPNGNGDPYDQFAFVLFDGQFDSTQPGLVMINVTAVPDVPQPLLPENNVTLEPDMEYPINMNSSDPDPVIVYAYITSVPAAGCGELYQVVWRSDGRPSRGERISQDNTLVTPNTTNGNWVLLVTRLCGGETTSTNKFGYVLADGRIQPGRADSEVTKSPEYFYQVTVKSAGQFEQIGNAATTAGPAAASTILALLCVGAGAAGLVWFMGRANRRKDALSTEGGAAVTGGAEEEGAAGAEITMDRLPVINAKPRDKTPLEELLLDNGLQIVSTLSDVTQITEADELAKALVNVFEYHSSTMMLLRHFILREVAASSSAGTLFRSNSMASKLIKVYSFLVGSYYLKETIGQPIQEICSKSISHELDPSKLGPKEDLMVNAERLTDTTQNILDWIATASHNSPQFFKWISMYLFQSVGEKYPAAKYTAVGGFLFLRYWCPAVTTPESYGLVPKPPGDVQRRTLVLVAKVLQNLANGVMFGGKEEFMTPMNKFIEGNTDSIKDYFESMSIVRNPNLPAGADIAEEDKKESLGVIHRHLAAGLKKIEPLMTQAQPSTSLYTPMAQNVHVDSSSGLPHTESSVALLAASGNVSVPTTPLGDAPPPPFTDTVVPSASGAEEQKSMVELYQELVRVLGAMGPPPERKKK